MILKVEALVDTGAVTLCIPEHVAIQLNLDVLEQREVTTAQGKKHKCDYVGPVQIRFGIVKMGATWKTRPATG